MSKCVWRNTSNVLNNFVIILANNINEESLNHIVIV